MKSKHIKIEVKNRKGETIFSSSTIDPSDSVLEFKKHLL